jgi:hypothetical protein
MTSIFFPIAGTSDFDINIGLQQKIGNEKEKYSFSLFNNIFIIALWCGRWSERFDNEEKKLIFFGFFFSVVQHFFSISVYGQ